MTSFTAADWEILGRGVLEVLRLFAISVVVSAVLGSVLGLASSGTGSRWMLPIRVVIRVLSAAVRGIPQIILLLFVYFGPAFLGFRLDTSVAALIVLIAFGSLSFAEVVRGAVDSVDRGQWEAARSLGLSYLSTLRCVIVPQALTIALPSSVGLAAQLMKLTSITTVIGVTELLRAGNIVAVRTGEPFAAFVAVGAIYLVLALPMIVVGRRVESRMLVKGKS